MAKIKHNYLKLLVITSFFLFVSTMNGEEEYSFFKPKPDFVKNRISFDIDYGASFFANNKKISDGKNLKNAGNLELKYAFTRFYPMKNTWNLYYSGEYIGLENVNCTLSPVNNDVGLDIDMWRIPLGYANGIVVQPREMRYILYHSAEIAWNRVDVPNYQILTDKYINTFDEHYKFGTQFDWGIKVMAKPYLLINAGIGRTIIFPGFNFWQYSASAITELVLQRTLDWADYSLVSKDPVLYPFLVWIAKGAVSELFYSSRSKKEFYPFGGSRPLSYSSFKVGIKILLNLTTREEK